MAGKPVGQPDHTVTSSLARIHQALREYGAAGLGWLVLARVLHRVSGGRCRIVPYVIVAQPIGRTADVVRPDPSTVTVRIDRHDPVIASFPRESGIVQRRFDEGAECYVTRNKGVFAGHIWLARRLYREDEVRCTYVLPEGTAYVWDFDVYVAERFRLGRTMARMWGAVGQALARDGVAWTFSRISLFNPGSLSSHRRLGAVAIDRVTFVTFGQWQLTVKTSWPWFDLASPSGHGPELTLDSPHATEGPVHHPRKES